MAVSVEWNSQVETIKPANMHLVQSSYNYNNNLLLGSFHHKRGFQKGPIKTKYTIYKQVEIYKLH